MHDEHYFLSKENPFTVYGTGPWYSGVIMFFFFKSYLIRTCLETFSYELNYTEAAVTAESSNLGLGMEFVNRLIVNHFVPVQIKVHKLNA